VGRKIGFVMCACLALCSLLLSTAFHASAAALTPVPSITGKPYAEVKARLLTAGWKPRRVCIETKEDCSQYGLTAEMFRNRGYVEVEHCAADGPYCIFHYTDARGRCLRLSIEGELNPSGRSALKVIDWSRECPE
jgi:hypothetical protein